MLYIYLTCRHKSICFKLPPWMLLVNIHKRMGPQKRVQLIKRSWWSQGPYNHDLTVTSVKQASVSSWEWEKKEKFINIPQSDAKYLDRWADWVPRYHGKAVKQASSDWLLGSSPKELWKFKPIGKWF